MAQFGRQAGLDLTGSRRVMLRAGNAGIAIYPVFVTVVVLLTWLEWDFMRGTGWSVLDDGGVNYPSGLARGSLGLLQALNFLIISVLALIFGQGLRTQFVRRWSGRFATIGIGSVGVSGVFSAFPTDLPGEPASWHGALHGVGFVLLMLGLAVAMVASGLALRGIANWRGYWIYSLLNVPLAILVSAALTPLGQVSFYGFITVLLLWFAVMGQRMRTCT